MELNSIISKISKIKNGTFVRISYRTELPVRAEFKKAGYRVIKNCTTTTRTGVYYGNIKEIKEKMQNEGYQISRNENLEWTVKNTIQYNKNTNKHYLCIYPIARGRNTKVKYTVVTPQGTYLDNDFDRGLVIESYFNRKNNGVSKMMKIDTKNIIKIGG